MGRAGPVALRKAWRIKDFFRAVLTVSKWRLFKNAYPCILDLIYSAVQLLSY